jgi:head-tail adaptor
MRGEKISGKRRKVNIGDMFSVIAIQNRNIKPSSTDHEYYLDFTEKDTNGGAVSVANGETWANIETVEGVTVFDSTGVEQAISHIFRIRYLPITTEQWVLWEGNRYNIVTIENYDQRSEFLRLNCIFKGTITNFNNVA